MKIIGFGVLSFFVFVVAFVYLFARPTKQRTTNSNELIQSNVVVEGVDPVISTIVPIEASLIVKGRLPNPCSQVGEVIDLSADNKFEFIIRAHRPTDVECKQDNFTFEQIIPVDIASKSAGTYQVVVNGFETSLKLP